MRPKKRNVRLDGYDLGDGVSLHQSPVTVHQGHLDAGGSQEGGVVPGGGDGSEQEGPVTPKIKKGAKEVCNEIEKDADEKVAKRKGADASFDNEFEDDDGGASRPVVGLVILQHT